MKSGTVLLFLITFHLISYGQTERKHVRQGNRFYLEGLKDTTKLDTLTFSKAETEYRKALDKKPDDLKWNFNLNNSLYKQAKLQNAAQGYEDIVRQLAEPKEKAKVLHNLGNTQLFQQQIDESIESYKKALRNNPDDLETKYNLAYAQRLKKQQQQQNKDKKEDQNKDQNQDQKKDQQQQQQQQQPPPKISKQNAEQLLQALQNDEKNIQEKVKKAQAVQVKSSKVEKDW